MARQAIKARGETEHLPAEDAVRVSEEWYRAIYDGSPLAMAVWDTERRVVDWNRQAETVFGWTREEVLGKDFFSFLLPASALPAVAGIVDALLAGNLPSRSINENLTKRGEAILCEWNNSIQHDSQGKVTGVISLALDITQQKRAEDALRLFKESVENASDAVGMSTPEGKHYYQNKAFDELFGAIGENPPETLYVVPAIGHEVFRTIMAGDPWTGEVQMYARDRKVLTILLRAYASKDQSGRITGLVGVHTDITKHKRVIAYHEACHMILQRLNERVDLKKAIQHVLIALKQHTGADAVGIRMQEGEDFPYHAQELESANFSGAPCVRSPPPPHTRGA